MLNEKLNEQARRYANNLRIIAELKKNPPAKEVEGEAIQERKKEKSEKNRNKVILPKLRGVGITRKNKSKSKKNLKTEKTSRAKNFKIAKKVSRPTGSKKRV